MLAWQNNAAKDGLCNTYYIFNEILFDNLKKYRPISQEPQVEQMLTLQTLNIPSYSDKLIHNHILDKNYSLYIY